MKKALLNVTLLATATMIGFSSVTAQMTIKLPGIKKIVKPDIRVEADTIVRENNRDNVTTTDTSTGRTGGNGSTDWWIDYQIEGITKYKQQLDGWNPANEIFPKPSSSDDYISLALSKKERASWLQAKKVAPSAKLDASLDELKASLTRRLPEYMINNGSF